MSNEPGPKSFTGRITLLYCTVLYWKNNSIDDIGNNLIDNKDCCHRNSKGFPTLLKLSCFPIYFVQSQFLNSLRDVPLRHPQISAKIEKNYKF